MRPKPGWRSFSAGFKKSLETAPLLRERIALKYVVLTAVVVFFGFLFASGIAVNIGRSAYGQIMAFFNQTPPRQLKSV